ncbi:MAG TPA: hypothetical protein VGJ20_43415 [Xanthobacteraceae bacterium]|jgi:hypothetical protein
MTDHYHEKGIRPAGTATIVRLLLGDGMAKRARRFLTMLLVWTFAVATAALAVFVAGGVS